MSKENKTYSSDWIHKLEGQYNWNLYWHQLDLVLNHSGIEKGSDINEIGVGTGLTSGFLKNKGYRVTTIDIDPEKEPDIVADMTNFDFPKADMYLGFEVFEHIPFKEAKSVWKQLAQKKVSRIAMSLPYAYRTYLWLEFWSPFFGKKSIHIGRKRNHINAEHHFWELGIESYNTELIIREMKNLGFSVSISYRYRNHHFFLFSNEFK
ncbi:class I SAM-dependent methyltransferase [Gracilimonas sp.]|uniref:class I SAM-dependent methyltransferase n=1 Tax=Gracilimonas sp. TaxID=1974203 RepID=UPI0032ED6158